MAVFLTVEEAASFLHTTKSYLYQLVHRRAIPFYKPLNGKILFDSDELENFVRKGKVATRTELEHEAVDLLNRGAK